MSVGKMLARRAGAASGLSETSTELGGALAIAALGGALKITRRLPARTAHALSAAAQHACRHAVSTAAITSAVIVLVLADTTAVTCERRRSPRTTWSQPTSPNRRVQSRSSPTRSPSRTRRSLTPTWGPIPGRRGTDAVDRCVDVAACGRCGRRPGQPVRQARSGVRHDSGRS